MRDCPQGIADFLRAYYHVKSADWPGNRPYPLKSWSAPELAKLPTYYVMELDKDMAETVAPEMPARPAAWLTDEELGVYAEAFGQNRLPGRAAVVSMRDRNRIHPELMKLSGRTIDVPSMFIAGAADWGIYQKPGEYERMQREACTQMRGCHLVQGAGHWVQQEQPEAVNRLLLDFLRNL